MRMRKGFVWLGLGVMAMGALAGCNPQEADALREETKRQKSIILALEKENQDLSQSLDQANGRIGSLRAEVEGCRQKIEVLRQGIERLRKTTVLTDKVQVQLEALAEKFGGELIGNRLQLPGDFFFAPGKYTLNEESKEILNSLSGILSGEDLVLMIVGYTDSDPVTKSKQWGIKDNRHLSLMRAWAVLDQLKDAGYPQERMYPTGWGELFPVRPNDSKENKRLNRRVEILIDPAASGLFPISAIYGVEPVGAGEGVSIEQ